MKNHSLSSSAAFWWNMNLHTYQLDLCKAMRAGQARIANVKTVQDWQSSLRCFSNLHNLQCSYPQGSLTDIGKSREQLMTR